VLAADLFELAWSFIEAENAEVRSAVLIAVATAVPYLAREYVARRLLFGSEGGGGGGDSVVGALYRLKLHDSDRGCRELASAILGSLVLEGDDVW